VGVGVGLGVGVGEGAGCWTVSCAQRGCGCCCTHTWCWPSPVSGLMVTVWVKLPDWSATAPPRALLGLSRKMTIGSPGVNPLPVTVTGEPLGAAAALRFTLPWGGGCVAVGTGVGVSCGDGVGEGVAATIATQSSGRATASLLILGGHCT
jgi:hypothetical protein